MRNLPTHAKNHLTEWAALFARHSRAQAHAVFGLNGDTLANIDPHRMYVRHERSGDQLTVVLTEVPDAGRC